MGWKENSTMMLGPTASGNAIDVDWPLIIKVGKNRIRVTVEEEISECCEKWQAFLVDDAIKGRGGDRWLPIARYGISQWC